MKKLLALACAASVLALASGANAQTTTFNIGITGSVGSFCTLASATPNPTIGNAAISQGSNSAGFTYAAGDFSTSTGGVHNVAGNVQFLVTTNGGCQYSLTATNGALTGSTGNTQTIPYQAAMYTGGSMPTLPLLSGPGNVGTPITINSTSPQGVTVAFNVPAAAGPYPKDTYSDTLTLTINPQ